MFFGQKRNKYKAIKTIVDGIKFDSKKEANRYIVLKHHKAQGIIKDFSMQVKYDLVPKTPIYREVSYIADFVVTYPDGSVVVEDVKGMRLADYIIKKKLMYFIHKIIIREV